MEKFNKLFRIMGIIFCVLIVINIVSYAIVGCVAVNDAGQGAAAVRYAGAVPY